MTRFLKVKAPIIFSPAEKSKSCPAVYPIHETQEKRFTDKLTKTVGEKKFRQKNVKNHNDDMKIVCYNKGRLEEFYL